MEPDPLLESRHFLARIGFWPPERKLQLETWVANFDEPDREIALALLEAYVHVGAREATHAIESAIRALSSEPIFLKPATNNDWASFIDDALISFPVEQLGDATASGFHFAAIAEDIGFRKNQIYAGDLLIHQLRTRGVRPVIFIDDLTATGAQFTKYWTRRFHTQGGKYAMSEVVESDLIGQLFFCPIVATTEAKELIERETPVLVRPAYLLEPEYKLLHPETRLVPDPLKPDVINWLQRYSAKAGWPEQIAGYGGMGLALSLLNKSPNNTAPPLQWGQPTVDWKPIIS